MDAILDVRERKTVRSWVQFEQRTVENKDESLRLHKFVGRDVDYVIITPAYGKDDVHKTVETWLAELQMKADQQLLAPEDHKYYVSKYEAWKKGIEMPPDGTPIKGWGVVSPAQQKGIISVGILTVEDLAAANDEGLKRIGMGSVELKRKANAWLAQLNDKGPLTQEVAAVKAENDMLKLQVETLAKQVEQLMAVAKMPDLPHREPSGITVSDLVDEDEPPARRTKKG